MLNKENATSLIKINNPLITMDEKLFFLQKHITPFVKIYFDGKDNSKKIDIEIKKPKSVYEKLMNRVGDYLRTGSITLGSMNFDGIGKAEALKMLKNIINKINIQFDMYVRTNHTIMNRISGLLEEGKKEYANIYETGNLFDKKYLEISNTKEIQGLNSQWKSHYYQVEFINICRKKFLWGNSFDTGLGKTSTALMVLQDQHQMGFKEKTIVLVPKSTMQKWFQEAFLGEPAKGKPSVYDKAIESECLFVNLLSASDLKKPVNENDSSVSIYIKENKEKYKYLDFPIQSQLDLIKDKQYKKIFMTHEDFYRISLKKETVTDYIDYLKVVDSDFKDAEFSENKSPSFNKRVNNLYQTLTYRHGNDCCFEDLGVDSLIIDEAHIFKNSTDISTSLSNLSGVKYLSTPPISNRGLDLLVKTNYIRNKNVFKDGILALTATPLTNSPLEIYSMLSIVMGEYFINRLLSIYSLKDFIDLFCIIEKESDYTVDGLSKNMNIFKGLNNLSLLREVIFKSYYFLNKDDEKVKNLLKLPEYKEIDNEIKMSIFHQNKIKHYKEAYALAKEAVSIYKKDGKTAYETFTKKKEYQNVLKPIIDKFHEDDFIISSPFNFIRKMDRFILDEDLNEQATILFFNSKYLPHLENVAKKFNAKKFKEKKQVKKSPHTDDSAIFERIFETQETSDGTEYVKEFISYYKECKLIKLSDIENNPKENQRYIDIYSYIIQNSKNGSNIDLDDDVMMVCDTLDYSEQMYLYQLIREEIDISDIKFNISNKVRSLLDNIAAEFNNKRGKLHNGDDASIVKQLVFCDYIGLHFKLQILISQLLGLDISQITVLTGQTNNKNEEVQELQDNFNAEEKENKYCIVIANEKAEYGIDLQNGTQAIQHVTTGWTPDSIHQRNGRGVRQGNKTEYVNVYHYAMVNTFDTYKRNLVNQKHKWINTIVYAQEQDTVFIQEMLTREQQELMIQILGNSEGIGVDELQRQLQQENIEKEKENVKSQQKIYLDFILSLNKNDDRNVRDVENRNENIEIIENNIKNLINVLCDKKQSLRELDKEMQNIYGMLRSKKDKTPEEKKTEEIFKKDFLYFSLKLSMLNQTVALKDLEFEDKPLFNNKIKRLINKLKLINEYVEELLSNHVFSSLSIDLSIMDLKNIPIVEKDFHSFVRFIFNDLLVNKMDIYDFKSEHIIKRMLLDKVFIYDKTTSGKNTVFNDKRYFIKDNILFNVLPEKERKTIQIMTNDLEENNNLIYQEAVKGFTNLCKNKEDYLFYPADIINKPDDIYDVKDLNESILVRNSMLLCYDKAKTNWESIEEKLKSFEQEYDNLKNIDNLFKLSDNVYRFFTKKDFYCLFKHGFGKNIKVYPHCLYLHNADYLRNITNLNPFGCWNNVYDNGLSEQETVRKQLEKLDSNLIGYSSNTYVEKVNIFQNNGLYPVLMKMFNLIEYYMLNRVKTATVSDIQQLNVYETLTVQNKREFFDYKKFNCVLNKKNQDLCTLETGEILKSLLKVKPKNKISDDLLITRVETFDAWGVIDKYLKNKVNIDKLNALQTSDKEEVYLVLDHSNSFAMNQKYEYSNLSRQIEGQYGKVSFVSSHNQNAFSGFSNHATKALDKVYPNKKYPFDKIWLVSLKFLKVLLWKMEEQDIKGLTVKTLDNVPVEFK